MQAGHAFDFLIQQVQVFSHQFAYSVSVLQFQTFVATNLAVPSNQVTVKVKRLGKLLVFLYIMSCQ